MSILVASRPLPFQTILQSNCLRYIFILCFVHIYLQSGSNVLNWWKSNFIWNDLISFDGLFLFSLFLSLLLETVSLYSPGLSGIYYVDPHGLELMEADLSAGIKDLFSFKGGFTYHPECTDRLTGSTRWWLKLCGRYPDAVGIAHGDCGSHGIFKQKLGMWVLRGDIWFLKHC